MGFYAERVSAHIGQLWLEASKPTLNVGESQKDGDSSLDFSIQFKIQSRKFQPSERQTAFGGNRGYRVFHK